MMIEFALALIISLVLCGATRGILAKLGVVDIANERSSHEGRVVRGGGLGILAAILICVLLMRSSIWEMGGMVYILLAVVLIALVSLVDDRIDIRARWRFGCHFVAAIGVLAAVWLLEKPSGNYWICVPFGVLWIAGYVNAFNFMDGINGLAAGQGCISCLLSAGVIVWSNGAGLSDPLVGVYLIMAGACMGFLPYNFPQARFFMGDVGSATLGLMLAAGVWWAAFRLGWEIGLMLLLLQANFLLDTGVTLFRRIWNGERWYEAHRKHFYQKMVRSGMSHVQTTLIELSGLLLVGGIVISMGPDRAVWSMFLTLSIWVLVFLFAERRFHREVLVE